MSRVAGLSEKFQNGWLSLVTGVDPVAMDSTLMSLFVGPARGGSVGHCIDPHSQVLIRTADASGVLEQEHIQLGPVPTRLGRPRRPPPSDREDHPARIGCAHVTGSVGS
jgi:hypothetical protein